MPCWITWHLKYYLKYCCSDSPSRRTSNYCVTTWRRSIIFLAACNYYLAYCVKAWEPDWAIWRFCNNGYHKSRSRGGMQKYLKRLRGEEKEVNWKCSETSPFKRFMKPGSNHQSRTPHSPNNSTSLKRTTSPRCQNTPTCSTPISPHLPSKSHSLTCPTSLTILKTWLVNRHRRSRNSKYYQLNRLKTGWRQIRIVFSFWRMKYTYVWNPSRMSSTNVEFWKYSPPSYRNLMFRASLTTTYSTFCSSCLPRSEDIQKYRLTCNMPMKYSDPSRLFPTSSSDYSKISNPYLRASVSSKVINNH